MLRTRYGLAFVAVAYSILLLAACSNSTKASDLTETHSADDLSNCDAAKAGNLEYVDTAAYICIEIDDKLKWVPVSGVEDNPENFRACTGEKDGLYFFSKKENALYVCNDEEWIPVNRLTDNDSDEPGSSATQSSSSVETSSSSKEDDRSSGATPQSSSCSTSMSSSSETAESSSSVVDYVDSSTVVKGTMTDERDGQTYRTVKIGSQTWMAENLNYKTERNSYCYDGKESYCTKYGRLYTWAAAVDSTGMWGANGKDCGYGSTRSPTYPVRGVCPSGWHLPTNEEWHALFTDVLDDDNYGSKFKSTSGWIDCCDHSSNGTDDFSFSVLPAGYMYYLSRYDMRYYSEGEEALFWSSTDKDRLHSYYMYWRSIEDRVLRGDYAKSSAFSVRCVKD